MNLEYADMNMQLLDAGFDQLLRSDDSSTLYVKFDGETVHSVIIHFNPTGQMARVLAWDLRRSSRTDEEKHIVVLPDDCPSVETKIYLCPEEHPTISGYESIFDLLPYLSALPKAARIIQMNTRYNWFANVECST